MQTAMTCIISTYRVSHKFATSKSQAQKLLSRKIKKANILYSLPKGDLHLRPRTKFVVYVFKT